MNNPHFAHLSTTSVPDLLDLPLRPLRFPYTTDRLSIKLPTLYILNFSLCRCSSGETFFQHLNTTMSDQPDYHWYHELGFIDNSRALRTFRHAVKIFMKATPHRLHIVPWDNTVSFHEMVLQFMEEHAEKYWGSSREVNVDDNTLKYPEDSARILEGMRNLLANKIRDFNRSKGSASYSVSVNSLS